MVFAPFRSDNGYKFCPFWSGIGYRFPGNYGSLKVFVISLPQTIWKKREIRECILRNIFYWCSNLSNREIKHRVYGKRQTANVNLYHVTKFSNYLSFTVHYNCTKIGKIHANSMHKNCFKLFLSAYFSFWKFLNMNLTFAVHACLISLMIWHNFKRPMAGLKPGVENDIFFGLK